MKKSIPGVGKLLGAVIAAELDGAERFRTNKKLWGYCGLAPSTRSSDRRTWHRPLLGQCNKGLRWAFIEASWVAILHSGYFGALYRRQIERGKIPNQAIIVVARRLCQIAWKLLREKRTFSPPRRHARRLHFPIALTSSWRSALCGAPRALAQHRGSGNRIAYHVGA